MSASHSDTLRLTLHVWRQPGPNKAGHFDTHTLDVSPDASFLEMLDVLNEELLLDGREPIAFDHDCREGICGMCSLVINGQEYAPFSTVEGTGPEVAAHATLLMNAPDSNWEILFPIFEDVDGNGVAVVKMTQPWAISASSGCAATMSATSIPSRKR